MGCFSSFIDSMTVSHLRYLAMELHTKKRRIGHEQRADILQSCVVCKNSSSENVHRLDAFIEFVSEGHLYLYKPHTRDEEKFPISVSGLYSLYFAEFDAGQVISRYFEKWKDDPRSKYYDAIERGRRAGLCDPQIADSIRIGWQWKGVLASIAGTRMHKNIELALGGLPYESECRECLLFRDFVRDWLEPRLWRVYRLEWSIFCAASRVAGQIDALFQYAGKFHMVDWKRCSKPLDPAEGIEFARYAKAPLDFLLDNPCTHYFIQQNLYAVILERWYGIKVSTMHLVQTHPSLATYRVIAVPDYRRSAVEILNSYAASTPPDQSWLRKLGC